MRLWLIITILLTLVWQSSLPGAPTTTRPTETVATLSWGDTDDELYGKPGYPHGIQVDGEGRIYINCVGGSILVLNKNGTFHSRIRFPAYRASTFSVSPSGVIVLGRLSKVTGSVVVDGEPHTTTALSSSLVLVKRPAEKAWTEIDAGEVWSSTHPIRIARGALHSQVSDEKLLVAGLEATDDTVEPRFGHFDIVRSEGPDQGTVEIKLHEVDQIRKYVLRPGQGAFLLALRPQRRLPFAAFAVAETVPINDLAAADRKRTLIAFANSETRTIAEGVFPLHCTQPFAVSPDGAAFGLRQTPQGIDILKWEVER